MKYGLDILATRRAIMEALDILFDWCMPQEDIDCADCPHAKICDNLHDICDELSKM